MRFSYLELGTWNLKLAVILMTATAAGCSWAKKPYANDPLIRTRRAVIANPIDCPPVEKWERPTPPPPPQ
jgi:hypothetical protein